MQDTYIWKSASLSAMRIIINADDFGPIDFINQGIYAQVIAGNLDSVQTLVNGADQNKLYESLLRLHDCVPNDRRLDVGVHYTLTSGSPLVGRSDNSTGRIWGDMVQQKRRDPVEFKGYMHFNFDYKPYLSLIGEEFQAQRELLQSLVDKVNGQRGKTKLFVNSVSSHHNMLTVAEDLFETYVNASKGLRVRAPKMVPSGTSKSYYGFVLPLFNLTDSQEQRQAMEKLNKAFSRNEFLGKNSVEIHSPSYIDIEFYKNLGSLGLGKLKRKKVEERKEKFAEMIRRAREYTLNPQVEEGDKIIEFVFHLGTRSPQDKNKRYKEMTEGYPGVTHKYFDNREVEMEALFELSNSDAFRNIIKDNVSWDECGIVKYV